MSIVKPEEPKMLTGSGQKARSRWFRCTHGTHGQSRLPVWKVEANSFVSLQPNIKTRHPSPDESSRARKERLWGGRQGESLATALNLLVFRQSLDRETGDGQSRQTHAGSGWSHLENSDGETQGHRQVSAARLSAATAAMGPHSNNETN